MVHAITFVYNIPVQMITMMQQQQSTIDKIFAYDSAAIKAKYDIQSERQRFDQLQQELTIWKQNAFRERHIVADTGITMPKQLQQENEYLQRQLRDVTNQLQQSMMTATMKEPSPKNSAIIPASTQQQPQQQEPQLSLEISLQGYKNYCKELEQRIDEQNIQHTNTVEILQQQIAILQDSLQTTRQRLSTRETDVDRLSTEFEQYKRCHPVRLPAQHPSHNQQHHEFPISPLSMTDSIIESEDGRRHCHSNFDTSNKLNTIPHTNTIVTIPQQQQLNANHSNNEDHPIMVTTTTTVPSTTTTAAHDATLEPRSGQSVASDNATTTTTTHHNNSGKSIVSNASTTSSYRHRKPPQIRSDLDRAKAMEQLEYDRIHNARLVQQLRQSVLLQQQQQQQQQQSKN